MTRLLQSFAICLICVCLAVFATNRGVLAQSGGVVDQIIINGAQRVEAGTIRSYVLVKSGDPFDTDRINQSLKALFSSGLFADVTMRRVNDDLVINVVENPVINRVAFEGNDEVGDDTLEAEVGLRSRVIFTRDKVKSDLRRILTVYRRQGLFAATVQPKVIQLPQNRVDLAFEINEGEATEVERIRFIGNKEYDDGDLREVIQTRESAFYRFLSSDDTYDPDRLTLDRELLRQFYLTNGYADFKVQSAIAELTPDRESFFITFSVQEGDRYDFGKISVQSSLKDLDVAAVRAELEIEEGEHYDAAAVEDDIDTITDFAGNFGFAFVEVRPRLNRDRKKKTIDVTFEINEGPRVFVERINIVGNSRTQDRVIRREFRLVEGDAFNASKVRRSRQRLINLDFFETVNLEQLPGNAPDKTILQVEVQEKSTGQISVGAGFSTQQGILGDFGVRERNFLGLGQDAGVRVVVAARRSEIDLSFTEPYFLNRDIAAGFDIFRVRENFQKFSSFDSERIGFALRAGYSITEKLRQSWRYELKRSKVTSVRAAASRFIKRDEGSDTLSIISHNIHYEDRDNPVRPTTGFFISQSTNLAGLGGNLSFVRNRVRSAYHVPVVDEVVLTIGGDAGVVTGLGGDKVSLQERFFVGGDDLRGFSTSGVGPRDIRTNDALGAEWKYTGALELDFPLGLPAELGIAGRTFIDAGSAGGTPFSGPDLFDSTSLRASTGVGLTWESPLGPLGIDLGFPFLKEGRDKTETLRVNFGTRF